MKEEKQTPLSTGRTCIEVPSRCSHEDGSRGPISQCSPKRGFPEIHQPTPMHWQRTQKQIRGHLPAIQPPESSLGHSKTISGRTKSFDTLFSRAKQLNILKNPNIVNNSLISRIAKRVVSKETVLSMGNNQRGPSTQKGSRSDH